MNLILASASPRRRQLLKKLQIPFRAVPSRVLERSVHRHPARLVKDLALKKARAVARRHRGSVVLGADTVVVLGRAILGKPRNLKEAARMLGRLSGTTHRVYTGVAVVDASTETFVVGFERSEVRMKALCPQDLYRLSKRHVDKAGSYAIQEHRDPIASVVRGSYDNVVGLPLKTVKALLKKLSRAV